MFLARAEKAAAAAARAQAAAAQPSVPCTYCGELFGSRTKVFKHLRTSWGDCTRKAVADGLQV